MEYGLHASALERSRRTRLGIDGVKLDMYDLMRPLEAEMDLIRDKARKVAADFVRVRLTRLEERFTRHRFRAVSYAFSIAELEIHPPFLPGRRHRPEQVDERTLESLLDQTMTQDAHAFIRQQMEEMTMILVTFGDDFNIDVGIVTTDAELDESTAYGMIVDPAAKAA